jgi:3-isopropylmalate/(R)-2-methylmalate dehydratase small subunit
MGWKLGTDELSPEALAKNFMVAIDPEIARITKKGDILVCGRNFGFGKAHPAFFIALKQLEIKCVVAESFSTQFFSQALMNALFMVEIDDVLERINCGDEIEVDVENAMVMNLTQNTNLMGEPLPAYVMETLKMGGQFGRLMNRAMSMKNAT